MRSGTQYFVQYFNLNPKTVYGRLTNHAVWICPLASERPTYKSLLRRDANLQSSAVADFDHNGDHATVREVGVLKGLAGLL